MTNARTSFYSKQFSEADFLYAAIHDALEAGDSTALWRLPNSTVKTILISTNPTAANNIESLEELEPGFMFTPFDRTKNQYYLKADKIFSFQSGQFVESLSSDITNVPWLSTIKAGSAKFKKIDFYKKNSVAQQECDQPDFDALVRLGIAKIEANKFEKIVPSRCKSIKLSDDFDPIQAFNQLCEAYPNAMVSLVSIPQVGTWLGASPEVLVQVDNQSIFKTVSLAGTKEYVTGIDLKTVSWTQKEIEEQALVSRYIVNCFKKIRLREFDEHGPKTSVAGNIMHLKTEFTVDMKATNFPQLGSVMLNLLHPTSAVCGMPLEPAKEFLQTNEGYDRSFYSGYLGPVNIQNSINIFVNLRCMQLLEQTAICYAGAGVTIDSDSQKEWEETETKMNTLLNVIL